MVNKTIVIADKDINYIEPLELKFVEEFHKHADLEIITDQNYFKEYFSVPRSVCVLVVDEQLFDESLLRHDIERIYVLVEDSPDDGQTNQNDSPVKRIFKYSSTMEIVNRVTNELPDSFKKNVITENTPQVILVYSMAGGAGTTTTALGLAANLFASHKRVIYVNAEHCHSFQGYMRERAPLPSHLYGELRVDNHDLYKGVRYHLRSEGFEYLPPLAASLTALNINFALYESLIRQIKDSRDYDFIVVDVDSTLNEEKMALFALADKAIILLTQDLSSVYKTRILMNNIAVNSSEKYVFVCNKFRPDCPNQILAEKGDASLIISEYIEYVDNLETFAVPELTKVKGFQKLAFLLM